MKKPPKPQLGVRVDQWVFDTVVAMAETESRSKSDIAARLLAQALLAIEAGQPLETERPRDQRVLQLADEILSLPPSALAKFAEFWELFFANWSARQNSDGTIPTRLGTVRNILLQAQGNGSKTPPGSSSGGMR